jgi:hypothetical protein
VLQVQLSADVETVALDGPQADKEQFTYPAVGMPISDQLQHFAFPTGQGIRAQCMVSPTYGDDIF